MKGKQLLLHKVISEECLARISEFWDVLKEFYCPKPISPKITISELTDVIIDYVAKMEMGGMIPVNKTIPKPGTSLALTRGKDFHDIVYNVYDLTPDANGSENVDNIIHRIGHHLNVQLTGLGYALRKHNGKHAADDGKMILIKDVLDDFMSMNENLPVERAAAVNHLACVMMVGRALGAWLIRGQEAVSMPSNHGNIKLRAQVETLKSWKDEVLMSIDVPEEIFLSAAYHIGRAEDAIYDAIRDRNRCFSIIRNFTTAIGESQYPHTHIDGHDVPLRFTDGRLPSERLKNEQFFHIPFWDWERTQPQGGSVPTAEASASSSSACGAIPKTKPQTKKMPTPPPTPPPTPRDTRRHKLWVVALPPQGVYEMLLHKKDHEGGDFKIKLNFDQNIQKFILSHIQGPMINTNGSPTDAQLWQQYTKRLTAYLCTVFDPMHPNLLTSQDDAEMSGDTWLRLYNHVLKVSGLRELGYYLNTEAMIVLSGTATPNEFSTAMREQAKKIRSEIGSKPIDQPWMRPNQDGLAGHTRGGTTIILTDLVYRVTSASRAVEDLFSGLSDLGWETNVINIELGDNNALGRLTNAVKEVIKILNEKKDDHSRTTVHVWLSMAFGLKNTPPYTSLFDDETIKGCVEQVIKIDDASSRPIIVSVNHSDSFLGVKSQIEVYAKAMIRDLKESRIITSGETKMWRSMYSVGGNHYQRYQGSDKRAIWAACEKWLFRQRMILMCSMDRDVVNNLNGQAMMTVKVGIRPEDLRQCTRPILSSPSTGEVPQAQRTAGGPGSARMCLGKNQPRKRTN